MSRLPSDVDPGVSQQAGGPDHRLALVPGMSARAQRPLRVLFLNHNVVRAGGTFFRAFDFAKHLVRRGHRVKLLAISQDARWRVTTEIVDGVEIVHTPDWFWGIGRTGWDPWDTAVRVKLAASEEWDVIHAWDSRPAVMLPALAARALQKRRPRLAVDWSDWWGRGGTQSERGEGWTRYLYNAIETFFEESFRRFADGATVISTPLRDRAIRVGVRPELIRILAQGCDDFLPLDLTREEAKRELGLSPGVRLFITIGILNISDARFLFDVIRSVGQREPEARFALLGRLRLQIPADLRGPAVDDVGYVSNEMLSVYLAAADALIVPLANTISSRGRWPSRVNLALSRGVPIVIPCVGDLPRLLEAEGAAFVTMPDVEDFARTLTDKTSNAAAVAAVVANGERLAAELLPWPKLAAELETFYYQLIDRQA